MKEYDYEKNEDDPTLLSRGSEKYVYWICSTCNHKWRSYVYNRVRGNGCPVCGVNSFIEKNNILLKYPQIKNIWSKKNKKDPSQYLGYTNYKKEKIIFQCYINPKHEYERSLSTIIDTIRKSLKRISVKDKKTGEKIINYDDIKFNFFGCSYCAGKMVLKEESLGAKYPELVKQWHKDNDKSPFELAIHSSYYAKWKCAKCGYIWNATVSNRINSKIDCPQCLKLNPYWKNHFNVIFKDIYEYITKNKTIPFVKEFKIYYNVFRRQIDHYNKEVGKNMQDWWDLLILVNEKIKTIDELLYAKIQVEIEDKIVRNRK